MPNPSERLEETDFGGSRLGYFLCVIGYVCYFREGGTQMIVQTGVRAAGVVLAAAGALELLQLPNEDRKLLYPRSFLVRGRST